MITEEADQERDAIRVKEKGVVDRWIEIGLGVDQIDVARFQTDVAHVPAIVLVGITEELVAAPGLMTGLEDVECSKIVPFLGFL